ncbi:MAG: hemerythrin domain-containing protein [Hyphomicrobium aestuarii]|nr:hemerythrin domain-containing protein [Hyphomicrobium aestuarii]
MRPPIARPECFDDLGQLFAAAPTVALLSDPLAYILADHGRQRAACGALEAYAAAGRLAKTSADIVAAFLTRDVPLHFADEEEDLFPALRQRALPEDRIEPVLVGLVSDHSRCRDLTSKIVSVLSAGRSRDPVKLAPSIGAIMRAYSLTEQRHLAVENAIVIPIAQGRLKSDDLKVMSLHMRARRGVME